MSLLLSNEFSRNLKHEVSIVYVEVERHRTCGTDSHQTYTQLQMGRIDLLTLGSSRPPSPTCAHIIAA